ncbi:MAG: hypothetical protein OXM55_07855 [Bdellovibrionales bacterium]|nr:hypothetical protein [Bdellovibrionales bacterium]
MNKKIKILFKNLTISAISLLLLQGCAFIPSPSPQLQLLSKDQISDQSHQKHISTNTALSLVIKEFQIDDNTNLGIALSELYLAILTENSQQFINYISIKDAIHGKNSNEIVIPLDQNHATKANSLEKIDICLVKGSLNNNNNALHIENKWKCKSFTLSALLQPEHNIPDFALEDKSAKTPHVTLSLMSYTE